MVAKPVIVRSFEPLPNLCPARIETLLRSEFNSVLRSVSPGDLENLVRNTQGVYSHSFSAPMDTEERIYQAIRSGSLRVVFPKRGSLVERIIRGNVSKRHQSFLKSEKQEKEQKEEAAKAVAEKPRLSSPQWLWLENPIRPNCGERVITEAATLDYVWCKVDSQGLMPGDTVTFTVFLKGSNGKPDSRITTVSGRVAEGRSDEVAVGKWVMVGEVEGKSIRPKLDRFFFVAKVFAHSLEIKGPEILAIVKPPPYVFSF
jgi:hypothetical protein